MFLFLSENKLRNPIHFFAAMKQFLVTGRTFRNVVPNGGFEVIMCIAFCFLRVGAQEIYIYISDIQNTVVSIHTEPMQNSI